MSESKPTKVDSLTHVERGQLLASEAADALVRWRENWERLWLDHPTADAGHFLNEVTLWLVAGKLMRHRGIERKLK